jgi:hypothetical protein
MTASVILFLVMAACFASAQDAGAHYLRADVTNNLKDNSKCPPDLGLWTDKLQWAIKSGECNSNGAFTPVACANDQTKTINPVGTVHVECQLNELPAGNFETYCLRVIWCKKESVVGGTFLSGPVVGQTCTGTDCPCTNNPGKLCCTDGKWVTNGAMYDQLCQKLTIKSGITCSGKCSEESCEDSYGVFNKCDPDSKCEKSTTAGPMGIGCVCNQRTAECDAASKCSGKCNTDCGSTKCTQGQRCNPSSDGKSCTCVEDEQKCKEDENSFKSNVFVKVDGINYDSLRKINVDYDGMVNINIGSKYSINGAEKACESCTISWGDGKTEDSLLPGGSYTYKGRGTYEIKYSCKCGGKDVSSTDKVDYRVCEDSACINPTVKIDASSVEHGSGSDKIIYDAVVWVDGYAYYRFRDDTSQPKDCESCELSWGDGTSEKMNGRSLTKSHKYANFGNYEISYVCKCDGLEYSSSDSINSNSEREFIILFIKMNELPEGYKTNLQKAVDLWVKLTPLTKCSKDKIKVLIDDRVCGSNAGMECVQNWGYAGKYTRLIALTNNKGYGGSAYDDIIYIDYSRGDSQWFIEAVPHELGHTFGLCDEGYGNRLLAECPSGISWCGGFGCGCNKPKQCCPNKPEKNSIMCTALCCDISDNPCKSSHEGICSYKAEFAPTSKAQLEKELDKYCGLGGK